MNFLLLLCAKFFIKVQNDILNLIIIKWEFLLLHINVSEVCDILK